MAKKEITIDGFKHVRYENSRLDTDTVRASSAFYEFMNERRSVRTFSDQPVEREVIANIIKTAGTAPSGAHKQPWTFCVVSNPILKKQIREAAEKEEQLSYEERMSERWKKDLKPLATDANKPFLTTAPYLIIVFKKAYEIDENDQKQNNYYVNESVGIATGILITAVHNAGLITLTHTPSPMNFLAELLDRPKNERPFLLLPIGYPEQPSYVPDLKRKSMEEIAVFYD